MLLKLHVGDSHFQYYLKWAFLKALQIKLWLSPHFVYVDNFWANQIRTSLLSSLISKFFLLKKPPNIIFIYFGVHFYFSYKVISLHNVSIHVVLFLFTWIWILNFLTKITNIWIYLLFNNWKCLVTFEQLIGNTNYFKHK